MTKYLSLSHDEARAFLSSKTSPDSQWECERETSSSEDNPQSVLSFSHEQSATAINNTQKGPSTSLDLYEFFDCWCVLVGGGFFQYFLGFVCVFFLIPSVTLTTSQRRVLAEMESSCHWEALWIKSKPEVINSVGFRVSPNCIPFTFQLHSQFLDILCAKVNKICTVLFLH